MEVGHELTSSGVGGRPGAGDGSLPAANQQASGNDACNAVEENETERNKQKEFMGISEYAFKLAEETSSIPLISQGQSGKTTPDTFGAAQLEDNNANQLLRSIGYSFDDHITESVVQQSYEWLLLDPDVPDDEKGDFDINAHGSAAMVEKFIQNQTIINMAAMAANPVFGIDPKRYATQYLKSQRLDPRDFKYTDDEQKKLDSQPPPKAPAVEAATIRAQVDLQQQ